MCLGLMFVDIGCVQPRELTEVYCLVGTTISSITFLASCSLLFLSTIYCYKRLFSIFKGKPGYTFWRVYEIILIVLSVFSSGYIAFVILGGAYAKLRETEGLSSIAEQETPAWVSAVLAGNFAVFGTITLQSLVAVLYLHVRMLSMLASLFLLTYYAQE